MAQPKRSGKHGTAARSAIEPAPFFALRTPLLPVDDLAAWSAGLAAPTVGDDPAAVDAALAADRALLRQRLGEIVSRPGVREALFVASPSLDESLPAWLEQPESERGQKVERSLVRYFLRMAARPTPFGLFAGSSVGAVGADTDLALSERGSYRRHTRLDMDYVCALTEALLEEPKIRAAVSYRPNSSLYRSAGRLRVAQARIGERDRHRSYHLVAIEPTDYLERTLARAADGATLDELATALTADDAEVTLDEARAYVDELIATQVLVSDLEPPVTGSEAIPELITSLRRYPAGQAAADRLDQVRTELESFDAVGLGVASGRYRGVAALLEGLPAKAELPRLFQVDMVKPAPVARLGAAVVEEVVCGVELLHRLAPEVVDGLSAFRNAFVARYETREVPLLEALDSESGIGLGGAESLGAHATPLLEGFAFPPPRSQPPRVTETFPFLISKLAECQRTGARELVLAGGDLPGPEAPFAGPMPDALCAFGEIAAPSVEALGRGEFRLYLHGASGPSGARLLGRFCHGDPELHRRVLEHLRAEEAFQPDTIFAEIVHLPQGRIGNILSRPVLRAHEIPYLGRSGAPGDGQIPVSDLLVSVVGDRVVLRSARLGRRVEPRLTTAHNFGHDFNLAVYRFLCMIGAQKTVGAMGWTWGPLDAAPFLPRVVTGRLVLSLARWAIPGDKLKPLAAASGAARWRGMRALREELALPRIVVVADGDNELPIDLDNDLCLDTFLRLVKDRPAATLSELFPPLEEAAAHGPEGRYCAEVVVPLTRTIPPTAPAGSGAAPEGRRPGAGAQRAATPGPRTFTPGSEWLFVKLYCGDSTGDEVLRRLAPLVRDVTARALSDSWFFIRYADPDPHVRVRLHGSPAVLAGQVLPAVSEVARALVAEGRVWKLQVDTYQREVERYGGPAGVALAEQLFNADSDAVLEIIESLSGDEGADARWRLGLVGTDRLLADLGFDLEERRAIVARQREMYGSEFRVNRRLETQLGDRFRRERASLSTLLDGGHEVPPHLVDGLAALDHRSVRLAPTVAALRAAEREGRLTSRLAELASSWLHMFANRLLLGSQRAQELVICDFLGRLYEGRAARARAAGRAPGGQAAPAVRG
jgi:thiopeptide-type bacteriocin biosynthesis protein